MGVRFCWADLFLCRQCRVSHILTSKSIGGISHHSCSALWFQMTSMLMLNRPFFLNPAQDAPREGEDKLMLYQRKFGSLRMAQLLPHLTQVSQAMLETINVGLTPHLILCQVFSDVGIEFSMGGRIGNTLDCKNQLFGHTSSATRETTNSFSFRYHSVTRVFLDTTRLFSIQRTQSLFPFDPTQSNSSSSPPSLAFSQRTASSPGRGSKAFSSRTSSSRPSSTPTSPARRCRRPFPPRPAPPQISFPIAALMPRVGILGGFLRGTAQRFGRQFAGVVSRERCRWRHARSCIHPAADPCSPGRPRGAGDSSCCNGEGRWPGAGRGGGGTEACPRRLQRWGCTLHGLPGGGGGE